MGLPRFRLSLWMEALALGALMLDYCSRASIARLGCMPSTSSLMPLTIRSSTRHSLPGSD